MASRPPRAGPRSCSLHPPRFPKPLDADFGSTEYAAPDAPFRLDVGELLVALEELRQQLHRGFALVADAAPKPALELAAHLELYDLDPDRDPIPSVNGPGFPAVP